MSAAIKGCPHTRLNPEGNFRGVFGCLKDMKPLFPKILAVVVVLVGAFLLVSGRLTTPVSARPVTPKPFSALVPMKTPAGMEAADFAAGCFWAREAMFKQIKGVQSVTSGYAGGHTANPTYEAVCGGNTGYAETVQIIFDPKVVSYKTLLDVLFHTHNPTTLNEQAPDVGTQYRSVVFYHSKAQKAAVEQEIAQLTKSHAFSSPIVTEVQPYTGFVAAEKYHQNYFALNPDNGYCATVVAPEVAKFEKEYPALLKK